MLATLPGPELLHPLYTIAGTTLPAEAVIDTLPGYAGSRPVRVGNLANQQVQLDVFGPVVDLVAALSEARGKLTDDDWRMVVRDGRGRRAPLARARPRHLGGAAPAAPPRVLEGHVLADDRPRGQARRSTYGREVEPTWPGLRDDDRRRRADQRLERRGPARSPPPTTAPTSTRRRCSIGMVGLLDPTDERFQSTVTAIEAELRSGSTVYRYHRDDGLPGDEGGFHLCAAWMIEAYLLTGRRTEAEDLFAQIVDAAGPDRPAAGGVRPDRGALAGQPPAGVLAPRPDPLRPAAVRVTRS